MQGRSHENLFLLPCLRGLEMRTINLSSIPDSVAIYPIFSFLRGIATFISLCHHHDHKEFGDYVVP